METVYNPISNALYISYVVLDRLATAAYTAIVHQRLAAGGEL
jgi:hypothetical protein